MYIHRNKLLDIHVRTIDLPLKSRRGALVDGHKGKAHVYVQYLPVCMYTVHVHSTQKDLHVHVAVLGQWHNRGATCM